MGGSMRSVGALELRRTFLSGCSLNCRDRDRSRNSDLFVVGRAPERSRTLSYPNQLSSTRRWPHFYYRIPVLVSSNTGFTSVGAASDTGCTPVGARPERARRNLVYAPPASPCTCRIAIDLAVQLAEWRGHTRLPT